MIVFNNITDEEHKEELKEMLLAHYKEYFGTEWSDKIPIKSIRDRLSSAKEGADHAIDLLYNRPNGNNVASVYANKNTGGSQYLSFQVYTTDNNNANITSTINYYISKSGDKYFIPYEDNQIILGSTVRRWKSMLCL